MSNFKDAQRILSEDKEMVHKIRKINDNNIIYRDLLKSIIAGSASEEALKKDMKDFLITVMVETGVFLRVSSKRNHELANHLVIHLLSTLNEEIDESENSDETKH